MKQELKARDTHTLAAIGLKNGDMLHIGNQTVELESVKEAAAMAKKKAIEKEKEKEEEKKDEVMIDTNSKQ